MIAKFKYDIGETVWCAKGPHPAVTATIISASIGRWERVEYRVNLCGTPDYEWRLESELFSHKIDALRGFYAKKIKELSAELAEAEMELAKLKEEEDRTNELL